MILLGWGGGGGGIECGYLTGWHSIVHVKAQSVTESIERRSFSPRTSKTKSKNKKNRRGNYETDLQIMFYVSLLNVAVGKSLSSLCSKWTKTGAVFHFMCKLRGAGENSEGDGRRVKRLGQKGREIVRLVST